MVSPRGSSEDGYPDPQVPTTLIALPLLYLQGQVEGPDGEVDRLGVHSSNLLRDGEEGYCSRSGWLEGKQPMLACDVASLRLNPGSKSEK